LPFVKIEPNHQITIPKQIFEVFQFKVGDILEVTIQADKVVLVPEQKTEKKALMLLTNNEQQLLESAKKKITAINKNISTAQGLSEAEADVAAKVRIIDPAQKWWWIEEWQMGERETEEDIKAKRISRSFKNADELIDHLRK